MGTAVSQELNRQLYQALRPPRSSSDDAVRAMNYVRSRHMARPWTRTRDNPVARYGFVAHLYERVEIRTPSGVTIPEPIKSIDLAQYLAIGIVALTLGKTKVAVKNMFSFVRSNTGYFLYQATTVRTFPITVVYSRQGIIQGYDRGWAVEHRERHFRVSVGDCGVASNNPPWSTPWQRTNRQILEDSIAIRRLAN